MPDFQIAKTDKRERLVFGFANVCFDKSGAQIEDSQGDLIDIEDQEPAVYDFVRDVRKSGVQHDADPDFLGASGVLVESIFFTPEKLSALGLPADSVCKGAWWLGFKVSDAVFAKVESGELKMFSVQGRAEREAVR
jgi:hypothetical protein